MQKIRITDITLRERELDSASGLSFKEQIEIAKILEKLHVDVIETGFLKDEQVGTITVRTIAGFLKNSVLCVPVGLDRDAIDKAWKALSGAAHPRINLVVPTSAIQMEYVHHTKPAAMLERIEELSAYCVSLCPDVEFSAEDATRSESEFLHKAVAAAIKSGVKTVTLCDSAGEILPQEITNLISQLRKEVPECSDITLAFQCKDELGLATANALSAVSAGITHLKTTCGGIGNALSLEELIHTLRVREDALGICFEVNATGLQRSCKQIERLMGMNRTGKSVFSHTVGSPETEDNLAKEELTVDSDLLVIRRRVEKLGYDLEEKDLEQVYRQFHRLASKKKVDNRDLEAIIAESTQQVSPTYQLVHYVINSGNSIAATACIKVKINREDEVRQTVSTGDGPIDAAFLTIEQLLGRHFELDDFQIQAVTEGREAMGDALVKLRHNGKLYSGHGLSTDIIGASINAYLNAVNKIVYEEKES